MKIPSSTFHCGRSALRIFALIAFVFMTSFGFTEISGAAENTFPFHAGEKLTLQAKWGFIAAGFCYDRKDLSVY
jgi:hypothetical protein